MLSLQPSTLLVFTVLTYSVYCKKLFSRQFDDAETKFIGYIEQFNKSYRSDVDEYHRRFITFQTSMQLINSMNTHRTHNDSARFGFTEYSDMTHSEFVAAKLNRDLTKENRQNNSIIKEPAENHKRPTMQNIIRYSRDASDMDKLPKRIDWRDHGVVSKVRNQGLCGACWAHSVIETVESMIAIESNSSTTIDLSVQQMIDCAANNNGCKGGDTCNLLEWLVQENVFIQTMEEYPSNAVDTKCKMGDIKNKTQTQTVQVNWYTCESFVGEEQKIMHLLAKYGPVVAAVNGLLWQNYLGGIIQHHCDGSIANLNHAVQIVGYDLTGDIPYYIVRNSWGQKFGNKGYLKVEIGRNVCGLANQISTLGVNIVSSS